jgi:hypothetical protein
LQQFHAQAEPNAILAYACERPNSAEFYGRGKTYAMEGANEQQWRHLFADGAHNYAVIEHDRYQSLPPFLSKRMTEVGRYGKYQLLRETGLTQPGSDTSDSPHLE